MVRKINPKRNKSQAGNNRQSEQQRRNKYIQKLIKESKRERDKLLLNTIKRSTKVGLYNPKELKLTKYRRTQANKILKEFGTVLDPTKFFFVPAPKPIRKKAFERADSLNIKRSKTGLFISREGHAQAKLKVDKKRGEVYVERSGKTKRGARSGRRYHTILPLASLDELDNERDRLRALAAKLGQLKSNERLAFLVKEDGLEGSSNNTFNNIELLIKYLDQYQKTVAARINFYRHIEIVKTQSAQWFAEHPAINYNKSRGRSRIKKLPQGTNNGTPKKKISSN